METFTHQSSTCFPKTLQTKTRISKSVSSSLPLLKHELSIISAVAESRVGRYPQGNWHSAVVPSSTKGIVPSNNNYAQGDKTLSTNLLVVAETLVLTFLVLGDDWVAELNELSSSNLVDGLNPEVVLSVGDEVFNGPAHFVLSRHHVDVCPPASLTPLHQ